MSKPISIEGSIQNNFDRIYVTYYSRMLRFAREYVLFEEDAENVVQDVFLLLWEKREVLDIQISLVSYLFSLVKNRSLDYLRHKVVAEEYKQELTFKLLALEQLNYTFTSEEDIGIAFVRVGLPYEPIFRWRTFQWLFGRYQHSSFL